VLLCLGLLRKVKLNLIFIVPEEVQWLHMPDLGNFKLSALAREMPRESVQINTSPGLPGTCLLEAEMAQRYLQKRSHPIY
jgi:hypothetical protein